MDSLPMLDSTKESQLTISNIICKHFWFEEDALQTAIICELCWQKVDQFHRYYEEVKQLHDQLAQPNTVFIKQEQIEFEVEFLSDPQNQIDQKVEAGQHEVDDGISDRGIESDIVVEQESLFCEETKVEIQEEQNELSMKANSKGKTITKREMVRKRVELLNQKRQKQDDFIKQHKPYECEECPMKFEGFIAFRRHMQAAHGKSYIVCCNVKFSNQNVLHQHVQKVFNPETFKCEFCGKTYNLRIGYIRHKERVHRSEIPSLINCEQCPRSFTRQHLFERHMARHEASKKEKPTCDLCGKSFKTRTNLRLHIDSLHEKKPNYICEICSKPFARRWMFLEHQLSHEYTEEQLKKQCPICKRWQKNLRYWKKHMGRHRSEGQHKCDECDHVSINLAALKVHVERRHLNNTSCVCDLCGKVYSHPVTLKEHVANAHTGEPLYKCLFCEMKFFSNATMYSHRKKAHPQEWQQYTKAKYGNKEVDKAGEDGSSTQ
ncbi:AAEL008544-PA [Aedes aegypti]|uniref:AAEL008544-PA n=1 Tax=Aedes aegypti TaxID=7159 RepID=Q16YH9_AEDAE|nr:AAEL008544-PA [Aedes aegypti]